MLASAIVIIFLISLFMAILSLRNQNAKSEIKKATKDLMRGKVIFHKDHNSSASSS